MLYLQRGLYEIRKTATTFVGFAALNTARLIPKDHTRLFGNMIVPEDKALLAIQLLLEGTSVRSTERVTQLHRDTILRLLEVAGERCAKLMDAKMRNLRCQRIQGDELWCFVGKKQRT